MRSLQRYLRNILITMSLLVFALSFSFTTNYADWYGFTLSQPSAIMAAFSDKAGEEIDIVKSLVLLYTFESNANPRQSSAMTSGFTFFTTVANYWPFSSFKYSSVGATYDLSAKLISFKLGGQAQDNIIGFGGSLGANFEGVELFVGTSRSADDFARVDFKHFNSAYNLNIFGVIKLFFQVPTDNQNLPSVLYAFSYGMGVTVYGPFLPNLEIIENFPNSEKTYNIVNHSLTVRVRF